MSHGGSTSGPEGGSTPALSRIPLSSTSKLSRISKKLKKKEPPVPMSDLPLDAPPVDCPPIYECLVTMKPHKKHRLSMAKRYFGKVIRGVMRLTPEKSVKTNSDAIGSEYTIDLIAVSVSCDDARRRLIFKSKTESRQIGPINKDEYDVFKDMIQKHRNYRQSVYRYRKEDAHELISVNAYQGSLSNTTIGRVASVEPADTDIAGKSREDLRNPSVDLNEKVTRIAGDIKIIMAEMKLMHKDLKELMKTVYGGKVFPLKEKELNKDEKIAPLGAQKLSEEEDSLSEDSDENMEVAAATAAVAAASLTFDSTTKEAVKEKIKEDRKGIKVKDKKVLSKQKLSFEEIIEKKDEKIERIEGAEMTKPLLFPQKRRDQLPKPAIASGDLGLRQLMAIVARRMPLPISFFEPLTVLQVLCEELRYSGQTLNRAVSAIDPADRIAYVTAFAVSSYAGMVGRKQKPFNPLLGETFDFVSNEGWKYHAEQVNHHPAISAAHAEGLNWAWWQTLISTPKTSWSGTIEATPELPVRVRLGKEDYCWNRMVQIAQIKVIVENASSTAEFRRLKMDGTMILRCSNGYTSSVVFRRDKETEVSGSILDSRGILVVKLSGYYDRFLQKANQKDYLFEAIPLPKNASQYYGFSQFACGLNEFLAEEKANAAPTDSRFRPDVRALENADWNKATEAKAILEKAQRARNEATHKRMWFEQRQDQMTNVTLWVCNGRYWQAKEKKFKGYTDMIQLF